MNDRAVKSEAADQFAVSASMRTFGYLCHEFPRFWKRLARLESAMLRDRLDEVCIDRPIYVTSLARSGTTVLLEMLAGVSAMATHRYKDFPPVWIPYLWNRFLDQVPQTQAVARERPHGDGILITPDSPEAMEEVLWMQFFPAAHDARVSNLLGRESRNPDFAAFYRDHIRKLLLARGGSRYLAKGNYNIARLAYLHELFPDARFIVPVRHPVAHVASLMRQHQRFSQGQQAHPAARAHLRRVGHFEFGLDRTLINMGDTATIEEVLRRWGSSDEAGGWSVYWSHVYGRLLDQLEADAALRQAVLLVRHEDLCARPEQELARVFDHSGLTIEPHTIAAYASRLRGHRQDAGGPGSAERQRILDITAPVFTRYGYS